MSARLPSQLLGMLVPRAQLGVLDGVQVVVTTVELWDNKVVVHLAAVASKRTEELQAEHDAAFEQYAERTRRGEHPEWVGQPGELLARGRPELSDDQGTSYRFEGSARGGTGSDWEATVRFTPGAPLHARELRYRAPVDSGPGGVALDLGQSL